MGRLRSPVGDNAPSFTKHKLSLRMEHNGCVLSWIMAQNSLEVAGSPIQMIRILKCLIDFYDSDTIAIKKRGVNLTTKLITRE